MTDSKTYQVRGAEVIVTASIYKEYIDVHITVDLNNLDKDEPDHSPHTLIHYLNLPGYSTGECYWWSKTHRKVVVRTGSQANRVIKTALAKIDDAISQALIDRKARKAHMDNIFPLN
jgi:hypothetical protein